MSEQDKTKVIDNEEELLKHFTPKESIKVDEASLYSAVHTPTEDKLWYVRVKANR